MEVIHVIFVFNPHLALIILSIKEVEKKIQIHIAVEGFSGHNLKELHVHHDILSNFFNGLSCGLSVGNLKLMMC